MSRHSLQQRGMDSLSEGQYTLPRFQRGMDHYKRQMDQLMARPDFLTNLAQSAGAMSTLVNNMLDPSVSDWSTATASGKPLLTSQEQVQFKEMLDPYVPYIRAFFKGEPLPHSGEQHGGAEELIKKMQQKLTKNMTYMGQHNVVMYGGTQIDVLRQMEQQANRDPQGDVQVYLGPPPVEMPLRFITTSIVTLFDVIRMISSMVGWERGAEILSVIVSALEVARGEWKRGITSFMGYFGTKSLWIGQVFKVFVYMFQTIPTAMNHVILDDVTELGRSLVFGMALNIFQTISPAKIRQIFIKNIDIINENNELLTTFFSDPKRQIEYNFDPTNSKYAIYFNQYNWGDLTEFQSYMIEAKCTTEMIAFHKELDEALKVEKQKESEKMATDMASDPTLQSIPLSGVDICRSLLGIMGLLPANCKEPSRTIVDNFIHLVIDPADAGQMGKMQQDLAALASTIPKIVKASLPPANLLPKMPDFSGVTGMMSSAFDAVKEKTQSAVQSAVHDIKGKVGNFMPKKPHWREQLKQLQDQVTNMSEHVEKIPEIQELEGKVKQLQKEIEEKQKQSNAVQSNAVQSNAVQSNAVQPAEREQSSVASQDPFNAESISPDPFSSPQQQQGGGRRTQRNTLRNTRRNRNRRIRASTRSLRQRARE